ncbi:hypothetical protein YQE_12238, partial [Dendroctonus ponderosae]
MFIFNNQVNQSMNTVQLKLKVEMTSLEERTKSVIMHYWLARKNSLIMKDTT